MVLGHYCVAGSIYQNEIINKLCCGSQQMIVISLRDKQLKMSVIKFMIVKHILPDSFLLT